MQSSATDVPWGSCTVQRVVNSVGAQKLCKHVYPVISLVFVDSYCFEKPQSTCTYCEDD